MPTSSQSTTSAPVIAAKPTPTNGKAAKSPDQLRIARSRRKTILRIGLSVLGLLVIIGSYFYFRPAQSGAITVRYGTVDRGDIVKAVTATGTVQAIKTVQVGSQVSGTISKLYVDFNSVVHVGELVAQLDPTFYQTAVDVSEANLSQSKANLANAQREEARDLQLLNQALMSPSDYDAAKTKLLVAQAAVKQGEADLAKQKVNLGYCTIHSPISGTVVSRNVDVGQTVAASLNAPVLFTIAEDMSKMQVSASVDEADIGQIQNGQDVKFTVEAYPGEPFVGTVSQIRINPVTQQNVVTYNVMIDVNNPDGKLLPGMTATVSIVSAAATGVLKVPMASLRFTPPPELLGQSPDTTKTAVKGRSGGAGGMGQGGGRHHKDSSATGPERAVLYIKHVSGKQVIAPVNVTVGLSDGSSSEILSSSPELQVGDSVVTGAYTPTSAAATSAQPGASAFGSQQRPGGGGPQGNAIRRGP